MPSRKKRLKIHHKSGSLEIFYCLSGTPSYCNLLFNNINDKPYLTFLESLLENGFYKSQAEKVAVKKLAIEAGEKPQRITTWIHQIYEDILELNEYRPELFKGQGVDVTLYLSNYDDSWSFVLSMPVLPREYETVSFDFIKAKMGTSYFYVKKIQHSINEGATEIYVWLEGGFVNRYRDFAYDKARFQQKIGIFDEIHMHPLEVDDFLRKEYKS